MEGGRNLMEGQGAQQSEPTRPPGAFLGGSRSDLGAILAKTNKYLLIGGVAVYTYTCIY